MKNILIPTNFSENSVNAVHYAMALFKDIPCHFALLYVNVDGLDYKQKPVYDFGTNILIETKPKNIDKKLRKLEESLKSISSQKGVHQFTTIHETGYFLDSIRKHIQEKEIELIVMGTKGASELKEFFMGSNTGDVITKVECDVLTIPEKAQYQGFTEVVLPVDFTLEYSDDILLSISNIITSETTGISVLHITKAKKSLTLEDTKRKEDLLQRLNESLPNPISFHTLTSKNVENAILDFVEDTAADLIIMVSKDHTFLHRQFLDTTVEEVSFDTNVPLLSLQG